MKDESLGEKLFRRKAYAGEFQRIFGLKLSSYLNPFTGFDICKFDEDIKVPVGISCADFVKETYGQDAVKMILGLIH